MKKYLLLALAAAGLAFFATAALADDDNKNSSSNKNEIRKMERLMERLEKFELPEVESSATPKSSLFVGPQGQVRILNGELTQLGTTTPAIDGVQVWGLNLKVDITGAKFIPANTTRANLKVGDRLSIKGTMDGATGIIKASIVHALSSRERLLNDLFDQIVKLIERLRELQQKAGLPLTPLPTPPSP